MALTISCPICGKRNGYEFRYGGVEKGPRPDEEGLTPANWCDYVHMNECVAGIQKEWWFHRSQPLYMPVGSAYFPAALNITAPGVFTVWTANAAILACR